MTKKHCTCLLTALVSISSSSATWATDSPVCIADCSDSGAAVSSLLLAAGMYGGLDSASAYRLDLSRNESAKMFKGVLAEQGQLDGQDITLSYAGSEGRLGFSAGYIYTAPENSPEAGTVLLGFDAQHSRNILHDDGERPWYFTFNLSKDFQLSDSIALGLDSRTMLLTPSLLEDKKDGQAVCLSFNLPVSYGGLFTVTPELQWSHSLEVSEQATNSNLEASASAAEKNPNTFYGGMSISFSY